MPNSLYSRIAMMITLSNLICGALSLITTIKGNYTLAAILILLAVLLDTMDGNFARKMKCTTDFGKELDSLCDLVSFGVAPAVLIYSHVLSTGMEFIGLIVIIIYIICGAYRLACFNVLNLHDYFKGIPITVAGALMAVTSLLSGYFSNYLVMLVVVCLALLMVSAIKVPKLKLSFLDI